MLAPANRQTDQASARARARNPNMETAKTALEALEMPVETVVPANGQDKQKKMEALVKPWPLPVSKSPSR